MDVRALTPTRLSTQNFAWFAAPLGLALVGVAYFVSRILKASTESVEPVTRRPYNDLDAASAP